MSALKRERVKAISGKQMGSVQWETLAVSATEIIVDNKHNRPLLLQKQRLRLTEEDLRQEKATRKRVLEERKIKKKCRNYFTRSCTNPSCDCWHPSVRQSYKKDSGCKLGDKRLSRHTGADGQPNKNRRKSGENGSVALLKES